MTACGRLLSIDGEAVDLATARSSVDVACCGEGIWAHWVIPCISSVCLLDSKDYFRDVIAKVELRICYWERRFYDSGF